MPDYDIYNHLRETSNKALSLEGLTEKIIQNEEDINIDSKNSEIVKFLTGKNVFITGATGFLGKILMEKLMRSCPDIEGLYVLARPKKGKDMHTRLDEIFSDVVSNRVY